MVGKLTVGLDFILPPEVSGGLDSEVFTVYRIITQTAIPATYARDGSLKEPGSPAVITVLLNGVRTGRQVALGVSQLADLGWPVAARQEGER